MYVEYNKERVVILIMDPVACQSLATKIWLVLLFTRNYFFKLVDIIGRSAIISTIWFAIETNGNLVLHLLIKLFSFHLFSWEYSQARKILFRNLIKSVFVQFIRDQTLYSSINATATFYCLIRMGLRNPSEIKV